MNILLRQSGLRMSDMEREVLRETVEFNFHQQTELRQAVLLFSLDEVKGGPAVCCTLLVGDHEGQHTLVEAWGETPRHALYLAIRGLRKLLWRRRPWGVTGLTVAQDQRSSA